MADSTATLTPGSRDGLLDTLESQSFDVVVIGGGITGAGVARDASARGLSVAVLEADDFAAGTSSRSSKLIHGGLRYLAMGEVNLVRRTALERKAVHAMAPHLAEPCWMVVPARGRASLATFRTGIGTYEKLGAVEDQDRHTTWDADDLAVEEPLLRSDRYRWAIAYREYLTDDARLVIGVLRAAASTGAVAANMLRVTGLRREAGRIVGATAECVTSGRIVDVSGRVIVNAAGPWVESLARMEVDPPRTLLHLSKGVHAVLPRERLPVENLVILNTTDKRSIFAIPRGDVVYVGTTDTSYTGSRPLWPEIDAADIDYLLDPIPRYFDTDPIDPSEVIAAWSGVRPLVAQDKKDPKEISRKDEVWVGPGGMINIAGGKLTGFRHMAEEVVEKIGKALDTTLRSGPGSAPIPGAETGRDLDAWAEGLQTRTGVSSPVARRLVRLYGSDSDSVLAMGSDPVVPDGRVIVGEIDWAIDIEAATRLEDVVYRRTRAAWFAPAERAPLSIAVADRMAARLGWSSEQRDAEIAATEQHFADEMAFMTNHAGTYKSDD